MLNDMYTLGFAAFPGIGTIRFKKLVAACGSPQKAWNSSKTALSAILGKMLAEKFVNFRASFDVASYAQTIKQKGIEYVVPTDTMYPHLLQQIPHPPFILFAKGNISLLQETHALGVVGTRKVTDYGQEVTELFVRDLVAQGFVIVSGMALGVDGIAHKTALANNGKTIAVLGSGVDVPMPREHAYLYQNILEKNGLIVSTFAPGEGASKGSFPARNAIIAGLTQGILVTEGAEDSGSLITAAYAKKFGRPIFAVPGRITSHLSEGTNNLIKQGAYAVSSASDIIGSLGYASSRVRSLSGTSSSSRFAQPVKGDTKEEQKILDLLANESLHFDEIVRKIGKDSKSIGSLLSLMELKGAIKSLSDGRYALA